MLISDVISFYSSLELHEDVLKMLVAILEESTGDMGDSTYPSLALAPRAFGGSSKAGELGYHHTRAHNVTSTMLIRMAEDLVRFTDATQRAATIVADTDAGTAADLDQRREAAGLLSQASRYSSGDRHYQGARNDPTVNTAPPTEPTGSAGDQ